MITGKGVTAIAGVRQRAHEGEQVTQEVTDAHRNGTTMRNVPTNADKWFKTVLHAVFVAAVGVAAIAYYRHSSVEKRRQDLEESKWEDRWEWAAREVVRQHKEKHAGLLIQDDELLVSLSKIPGFSAFGVDLSLKYLEPEEAETLKAWYKRASHEKWFENLGSD